MKLSRISDLARGNIPLVSGVINISPESFYQGSIANKDTLVNRVTEMVTAGAKIIDIGAMSTRPVSIYGGKEITHKEEKERFEEVLPIITDIASKLNIAISIDTQSSDIVKLGLDYGIMVINDISGLKYDEKIAKLTADNDADLILMACNSKPGDLTSFDSTIQALQESILIAKQYGIDDKRIFIDPAFGGWQGRSSEVDLELIKNFSKFRALGYPIYVGVSRKSTIKTLDGGNTPDERLIGSILLTNYLSDIGIDVIRTHDVKDTILGITVHKNLISL